MKVCCRLTICLILLCTALIVESSPLYQNSNQSVDFVRTINRSASTDIDAAYFNPAGLAFMERDGLIFQISNQFIAQKRRVKDYSPNIVTHVGNGQPVTYEGDAFTWSYPVLYLVYKRDRLAFYGHAGFIGAGAGAAYNDGLPSLDTYALISAINVLAGHYGENLAEYKSENRVDAYAAFLGLTWGASYAVSDKVSLAIGTRYVYAIQQTKIQMDFKKLRGSGGTTLSDIRQDHNYFTDVDIHSVAHGDGLGLIVGADYKPIPELVLAFTFEYFTKMELVFDKPKKFNVPDNLMRNFEDNFKKGLRQNKTMPMSFSGGVSYKINKELRVEVNGNYFLNSITDWGTDNAGRDIADKYQDSWGVGLAVEYAFLPEFLASIGGSYATDPRTQKSRTEAEYNPASYTTGIGGKYLYSDNLEFTAGFMSVFFEELEGTDKSPTQKISTPYTLDVGFGVTYRIRD